MKQLPWVEQSLHSLDTALLMELSGHALSGDYDRFVDTLNPTGNSGMGQWLRENQHHFAPLMPKNSYSEDQLREAYNGKLLTFDRQHQKETLAEITPTHLSALFTPGRETAWPHVILTTNHALARNEGDLSDIMHGFLHLIGSATGLGHEIESMTLPEMQNLAAQQAVKPNGHDTAAGLNDKVVVVSACHTEKNSLLSGAKLLRRIETLSRNWEAATGYKVHGLPATNPFGIAKIAYDRFMRSLGKEDDPWNHMSPAAMMLAKNILNMLVVPADQSRIYDATSGREDPYHTAIGNAEKPVHTLRSGEHRWSLLQDEFRMQEENVPDYLQVGNPPVSLRKDAEKVAQHIHLMGYSRGGNTVTDALRYVVHELQELSRNDNLVREEYKDSPPHKVTESEIAGIIKNISLLSMAAGEIPLSPKEIQSGIRRVNVISDKDLIAGHFTAGFPHEEHTGDDLYEVNNGTSAGLGHDPVEALGGVRRDKSGALGVVEGYMVKDEPVRDALRSMFMPMLGKACISDIEPLESNGGKHIRLIVRSSAGTTEKQVEEIRHYLQGALSQAQGGEDVTITQANHSSSLIINGLTPDNSIPVLEALKGALEELDTPDHAQGITIYNRIIRDVGAELKSLKERGKEGGGIRRPTLADAPKGPHTARHMARRAAAGRMDDGPGAAV